MVIPVLTSLNTRDQWLDFCQKETPYAFVKHPDCLVDFQTTFLRITLLPEPGHYEDCLKYSLGSQKSMEPIWQLIKACNWDLGVILQGLSEMDFSSNVRDNALLKVHSHLSVRKFFSREAHITSPHTLGLLKPLTQFPDFWDATSLASIMSHQQFTDLRSEVINLPGKKAFGGVNMPSVNEIILTLIDPIEQCHGEWVDERLFIFRGKQMYISLVPNLLKPAPKLK